MLILSRSKNERVVIQTPSGEEITINVAEILASDGKRQGKVRLGFVADPYIKIMREEAFREVEPITLQSGEVI